MIGGKVADCGKCVGSRCEGWCEINMGTQAPSTGPIFLCPTCSVPLLQHQVKNARARKQKQVSQRTQIRRLERRVQHLNAILRLNADRWEELNGRYWRLRQSQCFLRRFWGWFTEGFKND